MTFDLAQRCRDEFPGTPDEEIPGLIRMLRLNRPDDQLRIERNYYRNYYRTLSVERAEEALIWRRRFEGPTSTPQNLFQDLEARVSAAASLYARELAAVPPRRTIPAAPAPAAPAPAAPAPAAPAPAAPAPAAPAVSQSTPPLETLPALELRFIRAQLGFSQSAMAYRLRITVAKLGQYEHGAPVPPDLLNLAREQVR